MKRQRFKTKDMILCALLTGMIAVGAFIRIPIPVVPFTLQFLFTMLAGLLMGGKLGAVCVLAYITLGLMGLPIFAEGGGFAYVLKPSFGYIIGFCVGAYVTGVIANKTARPSYKRLLAANFSGLLIVYAFGMSYYWLMSTYYLGTGIGLWPLFLYCFVLAVPGDIALCILSAALAKRLIPFVRKQKLEAIYEHRNSIKEKGI
ncbi:MAG: biotin transporter BioY [Acetanaerobacterium sp.]